MTQMILNNTQPHFLLSRNRRPSVGRRAVSEHREKKSQKFDGMSNPNYGGTDEINVELELNGKTYEVDMDATGEGVKMFNRFSKDEVPLLNKTVDQLKMHSRSEFEEHKEKSEAVWTSLPDSINGTLIYFLLVEQNTKAFPVGEYFQCLFITGMPVFFTFWIQGLLVYWISVITPEYEGSSICVHSAMLQHAVMMVFLLFMYPSLTSIMTESYVCLRANRVGFTHQELDDRILLYSIRAPMSKRLVTFLLIPFIECCILLAMTIVGSKFISTCDKTSDLIINSMAVAFVMDVDNMSREFFQSEAVTEHVDGMHFETKMVPLDSKLSNIQEIEGDGIDPEEVDEEVVATFTCVGKVIALAGLAAAYTYTLQFLYCQEQWDTTEQ